MKYLLYLLVVLSLSGCFTKPKIFIPPEREVNLPVEVYIPCNDLVKLGTLTNTDINKDMELILKNVGKNAIIYSECRNKHAANIEVIRQLTNTERKGK